MYLILIGLSINCFETSNNRFQVCEFDKDSTCDRFLPSRSDSLIIEARISSQPTGNSTLIGLSNIGNFKCWVLESQSSSSRLNLSLNLTSPIEIKESTCKFVMST